MVAGERSVEKKLVMISSATFIIMLGAGIVVPILPKYAESFGASYTYVGFTISAFGIARIITDIPSGRLSDKVGRRKSILLGTLLFVGTGILAAYSTNILQLIVARFIQGVGAAVFTTSALAYIADILPEAKKGRYLGYYQSSFFLGSAFGPSIGGFLTGLGGLRLPFLTLSLLSLVSALATYMGFSRSRDEKKIASERVYIKSMIAEKLRSKPMIVSCVAAASTFILTTGVRFTVLPIYCEKVLNLSESEVGLVLSLIALVNFFMMRWAGALTDRLGATVAMIYGFTLTSLTTALYALSFNIAILVSVALAFGVSTSLTMPAQVSLAVESSDPKHRGLSMGIYRIFSDIGLIIGPMFSGILIDYIPLGYVFYPIAGISLTTSLFIYLMFRKS
ncbi:MAG: MFS transporter [Nitrososphaerales archaeon]